jgi:23S rRNA (adenine2030-N6)-methyltransferase
LVGSGLIAVNPPFTLEGELRTLMPTLGGILSPKATSSIDWIARERRAGG